MEDITAMFLQNSIYWCYKLLIQFESLKKKIEAFSDWKSDHSCLCFLSHADYEQKKTETSWSSHINVCKVKVKIT